MKKTIIGNLLTFLIIAILYFGVTALYSMVFGLPPFNTGIVVGYPPIYYQLQISETETQWGFIGNLNLVTNFLIIAIFYYILKIIKKNRLKKDSKK